MVQPHSLLHIIIYHFGQQRYPFHIPYIDKWYPLLVLFIYLFKFCHTKYTKKESLKNTLQNKSGEESLNRNHRAYNLRLPQLQLMMATHAQLQVYNNQFQKRTVEGSVNEYQEQSVCKLINAKITANMIYYKRQIIIVIEGQVNFYDNETIQIY